MAVYALKPAEQERAKGYGQTKTLREKLDARFTSLKTERTRDDREHEWRLIKKYIMPRRGRFDTGERTAGRGQHKAILNNVATQSLRTMAHGMAANVISPSLPWFRLQPDDDDLNEHGPVREWLDVVERKARMILAASGFYQAGTASLFELGGFGTTALGSTRDFENVFAWQPWTCGTFYVACDAQNRPRTVYREIQLTIEQMVEEFGEQCSREVLEQYDQGNVDKLRTIRHAIEPFNPRRFTQPGLQRWAYIAAYWDPADPERERFLKLGGHKTCPVHVTRWDFVPPDAYGNSPCMEALGDVTGLQRIETRLAQGVEKKAAPAMQGPPLGSLADGSFNPFDLSPHAYNAVPGLADIRPLVDPRAIVLTDAQWFWEMLNNRIKETLFVDLFRFLSTLEGVQPRNTVEIMERKGEALLQLGPVLTNLNYEWLNPTLDSVTETIFEASMPFWRRGEAGMVPPPPQELEGSELQISYISALQQAQQATRAQPVMQLAAFVGQYAGINQDMADKFDWDQAIDEIAQGIGVPPKVVRDDDTVAQIREGRAQANAQAQQMAQQQQGAEIANKLGNASVEPDTALGAMMEGAG